MAVTPERIRAVVEQYVELVGRGAADEIAGLYADDASVEDPVGSEPLTTREQIREFYGNLSGADISTRLIDVRICGNEAVFHFEVATRAGEASYTVAPFDVMTFDEQGRITSMRAFWSQTDMKVS
ncbi:steroid delta-isomerase [Nocardioides sp. dk4132]|uniref:nuclear transport factor 2 family protein n=1 Tax=unclassified Nocardioides TaxID=2615069 RepID=UPI0012977488|nr:MULTISPECIES: nuclear transport factor 2 family protein [unclassified Nocardioides]MQW74642.1 steroid delta-isomerase [Nocardioides sp. dk4132]QGA06555.1 steroid delta-isomerase [Nocardioides sp. dk884]